MTGAIGIDDFLPTATASSVSTNAGSRPWWNVSSVCTTSLRPRATCSLHVIMSSHAGVEWRRPRASLPMFGAPPKPASLPAVTVHLQRGSDKRVHGILAGELAQDAV